MSINAPTASTDGLKDKIAAKEQGNTQVAGVDPYRNVQAYITKMGPEIAKALPKHLNVDRLSRIALTTIKMNPQLLEAPIESLLGAVMQASQLGLEPNLLGQCYFIPRRIGGQMQVSFQIGYKGMIDLCRRSGELHYITSNVVHEKDDFKFRYGTEETLWHVPTTEPDEGPVTHIYAYATMRDGSRPFVVMTVAGVNKVRDEHASYNGKPTNVWVNHWEAMAKKTAIKQLLKYLPLSVELQTQLDKDDNTYTGHNVDRETGEIIDVTPRFDTEFAGELGEA
jgi:recombination protein RecT